MTSNIFSRPPIRFASDFSEADRERFRREFAQETVEINNIMTALQVLNDNPRYREETTETLLFIWQRCQDNLRLKADFELIPNPQVADEILAGVERSECWRDEMAKLARKELRRREKQNGRDPK
jgi:hypothetical protein